ncbi:MAG: aminotransferase class I/II-fold pyridoxal phosphate-dependent enzyme [Campylobacterota bacterium]|nr:aminotransferase class I/II-fold pyridoxal phosphate-dependent enzyme [Campylobacterota bacterium]
MVNSNDILDFSIDNNFLRPEVNISCNSLDISSYHLSDKLYDDISSLYGVKSNQIELYDRQSSAIFSIFTILKIRLINIYSPCSNQYKNIASKLNYTIELINRFTDLNKDISSKSIVIFTNPSVPDGSFYDIDILMKKWIEKKCTIIVDESFLDFTSYESVSKYIDIYDNIYIINSISKFYTHYDVKICSVISSSTNIAKLKSSELLYDISQFDSLYIQEIVKDKTFKKISKAINIGNKEILIKTLEDSKYISAVFSSSTNFVLIQLQSIDSKSFQELLKPYNIMVKECSEFDFLDDSFIRISVNSKKNIKKLQTILQKIEV